MFKYVCQQANVLRIIIFDIKSKMDNQTGQPDRQPAELQTHTSPPTSEKNSILPQQSRIQHIHDANEEKQHGQAKPLESIVDKEFQEKIQTKIINQCKQQMKCEENFQLINNNLLSEQPSGQYHLDIQKEENAHEPATQIDRNQLMIQQNHSRSITTSLANQKSEALIIQDNQSEQQPAATAQIPSSIPIIHQKLQCQNIMRKQEQARMKKQFEQLSQQLNRLRLQDARNRLQDARKANIIVQMEKQTHRLGQQVSTYKAQYQQEKKNRTNQKQRLLQFQQDISQYQIEIDIYKKQKQQSSSKIKDYETKSDQFKRNLTEKANELQQINAQLLLTKNKHQQCEKQVSLKNSQLQKLTDEIQHNQSFILVLQNSEQKLRQANAKQIKKLQDLTAKYKLIQDELNNLRAEYHATQEQLQLKNSQINQLDAEVAHYKTFQTFKVKQQLQLENLVSQFKCISEKSHQELDKQIQTRKGEVVNMMHNIQNTIQEKSKQLHQRLDQVKKSSKEKLQSLDQELKKKAESDNCKIKDLTTAKDDLKKQLDILEHVSAQTVNCCYKKIDELMQQIDIDKLKFKEMQQEKQHSWQLEKQHLKQTICYFANHISTLQTKLEDAAMKEIKLRAQKDIQIMWLSNEFENINLKLQESKEQNQSIIEILKAELLQTKNKLFSSQIQAEKRQKQILDKIISGHVWIDSQQQKYNPIVKQNKENLVSLLQQSHQLHAKLFETKLQQKDDIIANYALKYSTLQTQFKKQKYQFQRKSLILSNDNYNLQTQLSMANKLKESKIAIEKQYASKQEILNDILYRLDSKKKKPTWRQILQCFHKMDSDRLFAALTNILTASCQEFKDNQEKLAQLKHVLDSRARRILELQQDILKIGQENVWLKSEVQKNQALKHKYYNSQDQIESIRKENAKLKVQNRNNKQLLEQSNKNTIQQNQQIKLKSNQKIHQDSQQAARRQAISSNQIQMISNQLNLAKNTIARLSKQLQQQQQLTSTYRNKQMQNQVRGPDVIMQLQNELENHKHQLQATKNEVQNYKNEVRNSKEKLLTANKNVMIKQEIINGLQTKLKIKEQELTTTKQQLTQEIDEKLKAQVKRQDNYLIASPLSFSSPQMFKSRANVKSPIKPELKQNTIKLQIKEDPIKLQVKDNPIKLQIKESPIKLQIKESPIKLQIKDEINQYKNRSVIFQEELIEDINPRLFNGSSILPNNTKEDVLKRMIQKFTSKKLRSAELKFKMQHNKLDYSAEVKNINISNIAWIFRTKDSIFGAVTFSRFATEQQSAIMFNLTDQVVIEPATIKSSWTPIKSDSFYLTFGVQQARYIWKSRSFSIIDSRSSLKYFDAGKPLVPNLLRQQKNEVEQFEVYVLQISV